MTEPVRIGDATHFELCKVVAEKARRKAWVVLYEYQSYATAEFPDVLVFGDPRGTVLYEIKTSRSDFIADSKKEARKKWHPKVGWTWYTQEKTPTERAVMARIKAEYPELYFIQAPHLGSLRYFVCESGLIDPEEVPEGWGLYWLKGGRMFEKKASKRWRPDVHQERNILAHAFRRFASGDRRGIMVNTYYIPPEEKRPAVQLELEADK